MRATAEEVWTFHRHMCRHAHQPPSDPERSSVTGYHMQASQRRHVIAHHFRIRRSQTRPDTGFPSFPSPNAAFRPPQHDLRQSSIIQNASLTIHLHNQPKRPSSSGLTTFTTTPTQRPTSAPNQQKCRASSPGLALAETKAQITPHTLAENLMPMETIPILNPCSLPRIRMPKHRSKPLLMRSSGLI